MGDHELLLAISEMMDKKLKPIDGRLSYHENKLESIDKRLDNHENKFDSIDKRLDNHENKFDSIDKRFDRLEKNMEEGFARIYIVLENEIRPALKLLAENYLPSAATSMLTH